MTIGCLLGVEIHACFDGGEFVLEEDASVGGADSFLRTMD